MITTPVGAVSFVATTPSPGFFDPGLALPLSGGPGGVRGWTGCWSAGGAYPSPEKDGFGFQFGDAEPPDCAQAASSTTPAARAAPVRARAARDRRMTPVCLQFL
jgi:hypothetical protein